MNFYNLIADSVYFYFLDVKNKIEFGLPIITGGYSVMMGFAMDFGIVTLCLGSLAGILGIIEKSIKITREYRAMKNENESYDKNINKNINNNDNENNLGSNI